MGQKKLPDQDGEATGEVTRDDHKGFGFVLAEGAALAVASEGVGAAESPENNAVFDDGLEAEFLRDG